MIKAVKEAKQHSSWINPNDAVRDRGHDVRRARARRAPTPAKFLPAFLPFQERVARCGLVNSLAQVVLKIASPGVPDFYQGSELWDLNLVDPDNRRPVDFAAARQMLDSHRRASSRCRRPSSGAARSAALLAHWQAARSSCWSPPPACGCARRRPELFLEGEYLPLEVEIDG